MIGELEMRLILIAAAAALMFLFLVTVKSCQQSCDEPTFITRASSLCEKNPFIKESGEGRK